MSDYSDSVRLSSAAQRRAGATYRKENTPSFKAFQELCKTARKTYLAKKQTMDKQVEAIKKSTIYADSYKNEQISALKKEYTAERNEEISTLKSILKDLAEARKMQVVDYVTTPPTEGQMRLLQSLQMRNSLSTDELEMLVDRCSDNFQALKILNETAQKSGKNFLMPFDIEGYNSDLEVAAKRCAIFLESIDEKDESLHYDERAFYGDYQNTFVSDLFGALDDSVAIASGEKITIMDTLKDISATNQAIAKEASDTATKKEAIQKVAQINNFINKRYTDLTTPAERRNDAMREAGEMLKEIMD